MWFLLTGFMLFDLSKNLVMMGSFSVAFLNVLLMYRDVIRVEQDRVYYECWTLYDYLCVECGSV